MLYIPGGAGFQPSTVVGFVWIFYGFVGCFEEEPFHHLRLLNHFRDATWKGEQKRSHDVMKLEASSVSPKNLFYKLRISANWP